MLDWRVIGREAERVEGGEGEGGAADTQVNEWSGGEERKGVCV